MQKGSEFGLNRLTNSETLSCIAIFKAYIMHRYRDSIDLPEVVAFMAAIKLVDAIQEAKQHCGSQFADRDGILFRARHRTRLAELALKRHVKAHGNARVKAKHHWSLHIGEQIAGDLMVLDTFVIERLHRRFKFAAKEVRNTIFYENAVLLRTYAKWAASESVESSLFGRVNRCGATSMSDGCDTCKFQATDSVRFGCTYVRIYGFCAVACPEKSCICIARTWLFLGNSGGCVELRETNDMVRLPVEEVCDAEVAAIWQLLDTGVALAVF